MKTLEEFQKEFADLNKRKADLEQQYTKAQAKDEMLVKRLQDEFGITPDHIDEKITSMELELAKIMDNFNTVENQMKEYVTKLNGVLNGK